MELIGMLKAKKNRKYVKPVKLLHIEDDSEYKNILKTSSEPVTLPLSEEDSSLLE